MKHRNAVSLWLGFVLLCLLLPAKAVSQRRIALVIGNATYEGEPLRTPINDATDMATTLEQLGFVVSVLHNASQQALEEAIGVFGQQLRESEIGLFYFAGRGVQVHGEQYLIPIGAQLKSTQDVQSQALPLRRLLEVVEAASPIPAVLILAASRDNPLLPSMRSQSMRPHLSGLTSPDILIAYATAPGAKVLEGVGRNSIYTKHLLRHITTPGLSLVQLFRHVRRDVLEESDGKQRTWESSSLPENFSLVKQPE